MTREKAHIIIVEVDPYDAEITADAFRRQNALLRIEVLTDGAQALDYIFHVCVDRDAPSWPHLVLLDLKLPKVDGLEVLARLRADERTKDLPVIVFTSSLEESDRIKAQGLGANDYVVKPVAFSAFMGSSGQYLHLVAWDDTGKTRV